MRRVLQYFLGLVICFPLHGEVYRHYDKNGQVHFSDRPVANTKSQRIEVSPINSIKSPKITYRKRAAIKTIAENPGIIMYSAQWCGVCKIARQYFKARRLSFTEYDIDENKQAQRDFIQLGGKGVPLILVGDYKMAGFDQSFFDRLKTR